MFRLILISGTKRPWRVSHSEQTRVADLVKPNWRARPTNNIARSRRLHSRKFHCNHFIPSRPGSSGMGSGGMDSDVWNYDWHGNMGKPDHRDTYIWIHLAKFA